MTDARHRFAYGGAAQRAFQMYVADMEPARDEKGGQSVSGVRTEAVLL